MRDAFPNSVVRMGDLAVPIQLIPKYVIDYQAFYRQEFACFPERGLVAFNQRMGIPTFSGKGTILSKYRNNAGQQICAGFIGKISKSCIRKRLFNHAGGRGFAVCAGHNGYFDTLR